MKRLLLFSILLHLFAAWLLEVPAPEIPPSKAGKIYSIQLQAPSASTTTAATEAPVPPPAKETPQKSQQTNVEPKPQKPLEGPSPTTVSETRSKARTLPEKAHSKSNVQNHVKQVPPVASAPPQPSTISPGIEKDRKKTWLETLHARISEHQRYPTRARRRGLEGSITVNLSIDQSGYLVNANIVEGKRVFHQPTLSAIQAALPLPPPNGPEHITLTINYRLKPAVSTL